MSFYKTTKFQVNNKRNSLNKRKMENYAVANRKAELIRSVSFYLISRVTSGVKSHSRFN